MTRQWMTALVGVAALALVAGGAPPGAGAAPRPSIPSDFDGDGHADLAIGAPGEDVSGERSAGAVGILYGSDRGLSAERDQRWTQASPGVGGKPEGCTDRQCDNPGDMFGASLASGDFDADGRADLAIGVPEDRAGGILRAGSVNVLYGSRRGLTAAGDQRWSRANLPGAPVAYNRFGRELAAGDFNGDGYWDLAISEGGRLGGVGPEEAGRVVVLFGGPDGLVAAGATELHHGMTGAPDAPWQMFGLALAAGDVDGDGMADLAVGAPDFSCMSSDCTTTGGDVSVFYGTPAGLGAERSELWSQDSPGILDAAETDDHFGAGLALGDFDADGFADLAIGADYEWFGPCVFPYVPCHAGQGAVAIIRGSAGGLTSGGNQLWHEDAPGIPGTTAFLDLFGGELAAGDFDGDGAVDLAIGIPGEDASGARDAGAVLVLRGAAGQGLVAAGAKRWTEASPGVPGKRGANDFFGLVLASADYGRSARADLAIGTAEERVVVLYGRATGLSSLHLQSWSQDAPSVLGSTQRGDMYGFSLSP